MGRQETQRWSRAIRDRPAESVVPADQVLVGVLPGEGVGPEVIEAATAVLKGVATAHGFAVELRQGPLATAGSGMSDAVAEFCRTTFASGGAILAGPHGGRWVYEVRRRLDLFCKINPIRPPGALDRIEGPISPKTLDDVDLLLVREGRGGVYQGRWHETRAAGDDRIAEHSFSYAESDVRRIIEVAATLARWRRGHLTMIAKRGGIPSVSALWRDCARELVADDLTLEVLDGDFAAYRMLHDPRSLDVIVAPNLFGDLLSDLGGALVGSRGITFGGSFDSDRAAVYQTNHGAAHDLAGSDRANPGGQILAVAMMLRESFGLFLEAELVERALDQAWRRGWRTDDVAEPGCSTVGTTAMGARVADAVEELAVDPALGPSSSRS